MITQSCYSDPSSRFQWARIPFFKRCISHVRVACHVMRFAVQLSAPQWQNEVLVLTRMCVCGVVTFLHESCSWYGAYRPLRTRARPISAHVSWHITRDCKMLCDSSRARSLTTREHWHLFFIWKTKNVGLCSVPCYQFFMLSIIKVGFGLKYWARLHWGHRKCIRACFHTSCFALYRCLYCSLLCSIHTPLQ